MRRIFVTVAVLAVQLAVLRVMAASYYVDGGNSSASDSNSGSSSSPWKTIGKANLSVSPGDTVYIKQGTYNEGITPRMSGTASQRITYQNFGTDKVLITETTRGILLVGRSYITVQGIDFYHLDGFMWLESATNNTIAYCKFDVMRSSSQWTGSRIRKGSRYNWIHHCQFSKWGYYTTDDENVVLDIGDEYSTTDQTSFNLLEDCVLFHGGHHVLGIYGSFNVIRRNYFHNENWSSGHGDRNIMMHGYDSNSGNNLIEHNRIAFSGEPPDDVGSSGMALITKKNIVRFNYFYQNNTPGIMMGIVDEYFTVPCFNKIYNNTFHHNGYNPIAGSEKKSAIGFAVWTGTKQIVSNAVVNNLFWDHIKSYGTYNVNLADQRIEGNWEQTSDPKFVDVTSPVSPTNSSLPDLTLRSGSPCIDTGVHLAKVTSSSGSGTSFRLNDAGYFCDGWGIIEGDTIQFAGTTQRAQITRIDTTTQTVTVDRSVTWTQNQGVSMAYEGSAPDRGAFEYGGATKPSPPSNLRITQASPN